jgi:hypothetical protein
MLRRLRLAVGLLFLWSEVVGCGGSAIVEGSSETEGSGGDPGCQTGSVRCSCYPNDTCDQDLVCASDLCVALGTGGSEPDGTAGTKSTGGAGSGGSVATGGWAGANGGVAGGSGGTGGEALCSNVTPCGGDVVGTWTVTASCLTVSGEMDLTSLGLFDCESVPVTGSLDVTGTWTANGDGTYSDDTRTTGSHHLELGEECKVFDATPIRCDTIGSGMRGMGYADASCVDNPATDGCTCEAVIDQPGTYSETGGIGFAPNPTWRSGDSYTTADGVLTIGEATYSYCVSGNKLRLTPVSTDLTGTVEGSVELQMQ